MKKFNNSGLLALMGGLATGVVILAGCGPDRTAPEFAQVAQPTTVTLEPTATATIPPDLFTDVECLVCHQDQERLQELAVENVQTESLSEGPG
ncbi:MAG TPA: hypothetical protein VHP83_04675 [Aggregatilineaceae bacterium]|nr:hypothetical protein [Aggregatilineaceae bacterium]